jgi:hypothetical protein
VLLARGPTRVGRHRRGRRCGLIFRAFRDQDLDTRADTFEHLAEAPGGLERDTTLDHARQAVHHFARKGAVDLEEAHQRLYRIHRSLRIEGCHAYVEEHPLFEMVTAYSIPTPEVTFAQRGQKCCFVAQATKKSSHP